LKNIARHQRRQREVDSIAEGVALFRAYLLTLETEGPVREALLAEMLRCKTAYDADVTIYIGFLNSTQSTAKGHQSVAAAAFVEALTKRYRVFTLSEYHTSQKCWQCGAQLVRTRGWSWRHWRCPHSLKNGTGTHGAQRNQVLKNGKLRHVAEENKDVVAALSMFRIGVMLLIDGSRPIEWCSHAQRDVHEREQQQREMHLPIIDMWLDEADRLDEVDQHQQLRERVHAAVETDMLLDEEQQFHGYNWFDLTSRMLLDGADESAESELDDLLLLGALQQLQEEEQQHQQAGVDEGSAAEM
jgi:hypothetical protein